MVDTPQAQEEKRLIILLPAELLEQLRQTAEAEDLSVSQVVRRAIRNELNSIPLQKLRNDIFHGMRDTALLSDLAGLDLKKDSEFVQTLKALLDLRKAVRAREESEHTTSGVDLTRAVIAEVPPSQEKQKFEKAKAKFKI
jgi:hypothetical protein